MDQKPQVLIGSPMCTAFSALQFLNRDRMNPEKWNAMIEKGIRHMKFAIKLYKIQAENCRWLLHEHPNSASSWKLPEMVQLMQDLGSRRQLRTCADIAWSPAMQMEWAESKSQLAS